MIFRELNATQCKCYLIGCEDSHQAVLVDPERSHVDRYVAVLAYHGLRLRALIDTHTHADHPTGGMLLRDLLGAPLVMHHKAPNPRIDEHVRDGEEIEVGKLRLRVLHTPGHTPDSISLYAGDRVLTGDVLLIGGTGRTDFAGGDSGEQYDSITQNLFTLPDETLVFPGHDYRGNTVSTIGRERAGNPRIAGRSRQEYIDLMASIEFPLPRNIQEVLQPNQSAIDDDRLRFPTLGALNEVRQLTPEEVQQAMRGATPPLLLDVREPHEWDGELGRIDGARLIPLAELPARTEELAQWKERPIVVICRAGVRSTTAAAILTGMGFRQACNLRGGMVDWNERGLPVLRD
jgi:sulfur dioxygenase